MALGDRQITSQPLACLQQALADTQASWLLFTHLLLVLPLGVKPSLDTLPGLLEGLSLGDLSWVVSAHTHNVGAGEDEDIGDKLQREKTSILHSGTQQAWTLEPCLTLVLQTPKFRAPSPQLSKFPPSH